MIIFPTNSKATCNTRNGFKSFSTRTAAYTSASSFILCYSFYFGASTKTLYAVQWQCLPLQRAQTKGISVFPTFTAQQRTRGTETLTNLSAIIWIIHEYNSSLYTSTQHCVTEHFVFTSVFYDELVKPVDISFPHKRLNSLSNMPKLQVNGTCNTRTHPVKQDKKIYLPILG